MEIYLEHLLEEVPFYQWIILAVLLLLFFVQMYYYIRYYNGIIRYSKKISDNKIQYERKLNPVSVIICAQNEAENLESFLPSVLNQDYPQFEVIVVNDGSTDQTSDLLERLDKQYKNLYHTFLPMDAKYTSRKKMCLTVGIKAAKYEHLLLLDADCEPVSKDWIHKMMENYTAGTDVVLGYSKCCVENNFIGKIIRYDSITSAIRYMGFALCGKAYEGVARNLSYKKELFFKNKGFSSHLNLISGDDNLFIQDIATPSNVKVEFSPKSITLNHRNETSTSFFYQKDIQLQTIKEYKKNILFSISVENTSRVLFYLLFTLLIILFAISQEWILAGCTFLLFLIRYFTQLNTIRKSAILLSEAPFALLIPILDLILPLMSLYILTIGKIGRKEETMWR